jgi:hypothetical protein
LLDKGCHPVSRGTRQIDAARIFELSQAQNVDSSLTSEDPTFI